MRRLVRQTMAALLLGACVPGSLSAAVNASSSDRYSFDIDETSLSAALLRYSELTGLGLVFDSRLVENRTVQALQGRFTAIDALQELLRGSGLRVQRGSADILTLLPVEIEAEPGQAAGVVDADAGAPTQSASTGGTLIDELLIIGTRTANPPYYKFMPTVSLDGQKIRMSGKVNVADELFQMPAMLSDVTASNTTIFGTPAGLNLADLRGLGPERTLVLVNGRRYIPTFGGNLTLYGVDLNAVPTSLIDRVEILSGGAATAHGGDAVSGVVNFVMRDKVDGWSTAAQLGITEKGDREEVLASVTYGAAFAGDRGNIIANLSVDHQGGLLMVDRAVTANPSGFAQDGHRVAFGDGKLTRGFGGSAIGPAGAVTSYVDATGAQVEMDNFYSLSADGQTLAPFTGARDQLYRFAVDQTLVTPLDRIFGTLGIKYEVAPGHRLVFDANVADTGVVSQLAPLPFTDQTGLVTDAGIISVPLDNPHVPDAVRQLLSSLGADDAQGVIVPRRMTELGPRRTEIDRQTYRAMVGLQGMLGSAWTYDIYYQFGQNRVREERSGLLNLARFRTALDPTLCAAAQADGCILINPFGANVTPGQATYYNAPNAVRHIRTTQHILSAVASGHVDLAGGRRLTASGGLEYRQERLTDQPDPTLTDDPVAGTLIYTDAHGVFDVVEAFADMTLPIIKDQRFIRELAVTAGLRVSDYSTVGSHATWHVGGYWEPVAGMMLRSSYQKGKRAPNIAELYSGGPAVHTFVNDPCSNVASASAQVQKNCSDPGPLGVPDGFVQRAISIDVQQYGNPDLGAETASNFTLGLTLDSAALWPDLPGNLRLSVDRFSIKVRDFVVYASDQDILTECYGSDNLSHIFCGDNPANGQPYIQRSANGDLAFLSSTLINAGFHDLTGFDIDLQYSANTAALGLDWPVDYISLTGRYSHNEKVMQQLELNGDVQDLTGTARYPRHRFQIGTSLSKGDVTLDWDVRYRGGARLHQSLPDIPETHFKAVWYHDLSARLELNDNTVVFAGVRNLFDAKAPRVFGGSVGDTSPEYYDVLGRRFFIGAIVNF